MPFSFLLDENQRGRLWRALQHHNASNLSLALDVVRVGDPPDLPTGSADPAILLWAERESRILLTRDEQSMPGHLADHLAAGRHSPGILLIRHRVSFADVVSHLVLVAYASQAWEWQDQIRYIP